MPLVNCPLCENQVSHRAQACPSCGEPDPNRYHTRNCWLGRLFWLCVWSGIIAASWLWVAPWLMNQFTS